MKILFFSRGGRCYTTFGCDVRLVFDSQIYSTKGKKGHTCVTMFSEEFSFIKASHLVGSTYLEEKNVLINREINSRFTIHQIVFFSHLRNVE